jgi:hypothetical protein
MKNRFGKHILISMGVMISFILILFVSFGCHDKSKQDLIPEKAFTSILADAYLADGLLSMSSIRDNFSKKDTTSCYIDIAKSYGYTYDQMEKTLNYYFTSDPKRLVRIYDKIDAKLSEILFKVSTEQENAILANARKLKKSGRYSLPDPELKNKPDFSYDIYPPGIFVLEFSVTVYPDDQSVNPEFIAWYSASDGPDAGKKNYFPAIRYVKDGLPHLYSLRGKVDGDKKSVLKGFYLEYENNQDNGKIHADILNLSFSYIGDNL